MGEPSAQQAVSAATRVAAETVQLANDEVKGNAEGVELAAVEEDVLTETGAVTIEVADVVAVTVGDEAWAVNQTVEVAWEIDILGPLRVSKDILAVDRILRKKTRLKCDQRAAENN